MDKLTDVAAFAGWFEGECMRGGGGRSGEQQYFEGNTWLLSEVERLTGELDSLTAERNAVLESPDAWFEAQRWEGRALEAEAENADLRARIAGDCPSCDRLSSARCPHCGFTITIPRHSRMTGSEAMRSVREVMDNHLDTQHPSGEDDRA